MPRKNTSDDATPRRRRGAAAVAVLPKRGLALRILLYSPKDMVAGLIGFSAGSAIIVNALFLQSGPHPAPIFGSAMSSPPAAVVANPFPRPRPVDADTMPAEPNLSGPRLLDPKPIVLKPVDPKVEEQNAADQKQVDQRPIDQRLADPLANLVKATVSTHPQSENVPRPPAPIPGPVAITGSRRVAALQRALTDYGYGQLKPTGSIGPDTRLAIEKFERERKLPVTGQVSDRLVRELAAVIGHPIE